MSHNKKIFNKGQAENDINGVNALDINVFLA